MSSTLWQRSDENQATIAVGQYSLQIELSQPQHGLKLVGTDCSATLFQIQWPESSACCECYIRGNDVIATFEDDHQEPSSADIRRQVYWRCESIDVESHNFLALGVIISSQTSLLDSNPLTFCHSNLEATELLKLRDSRQAAFNAIEVNPSADASQTSTIEPACFLARRGDANLSYVEMIHPADFQEVSYSFHEQRCCLKHKIFGKHLEKGVILRSRLQGIFIPRQDDEQLALKLYQRFIESKIPLTT